MADFVIEDVNTLLEMGKGDKERLSRIKENFEKTSMISMSDRIYVEKLTSNYLIDKQKARSLTRSTRRDEKKPTIRAQKRVRVKREEIVKPFDDTKSDAIEPEASIIDSEEQVPESLESKEESFDDYEKEYLKRVGMSESDFEKPAEKPQPTIEEKEPEVEINEPEEIERVDLYPETKPSGGSKKKIGIGIGIAIAIIIIGGGAYMLGPIDSDFFKSSPSSNIETQSDRETCSTEATMVTSTKVAGFPDPEKDLQYYLDRYDNEPSYKAWFDKNFPGETIESVLVSSPAKGSVTTKIAGFPDPEKDLQYYLDRYDNEPSYKAWFDKNFPGETVTQVICG